MLLAATLTTLSAEGRATIPKKIIRKLGRRLGHVFNVAVEGESIILTPRKAPRKKKKRR
jgi:bifunctional DNA-binding transcriptional regulator/antitoxin component of YhaV-PrlF toxin-antitoxin module